MRKKHFEEHGEMKNETLYAVRMFVSQGQNQSLFLRERCVLTKLVSLVNHELSYSITAR